MEEDLSPGLRWEDGPPALQPVGAGLLGPGRDTGGASRPLGLGEQVKAGRPCGCGLRQVSGNFRSFQEDRAAEPRQGWRCPRCIPSAAHGEGRGRARRVRTRAGARVRVLA